MSKQIVYYAVDNGIDGRESDSILYAAFNEQDLDNMLNRDPSKAWRTKKEKIIDAVSIQKQALAKLNGIDRLVLNLPSWIDERYKAKG